MRMAVRPGLRVILLARVARPNADFLQLLDMAHETVLVFDAVAFLYPIRRNVSKYSGLDFRDHQSRLTVRGHRGCQRGKVFRGFDRPGARNSRRRGYPL